MLLSYLHRLEHMETRVHRVVYKPGEWDRSLHVWRQQQNECIYLSKQQSNTNLGLILLLGLKLRCYDPGRSNSWCFDLEFYLQLQSKRYLVSANRKDIHWTEWRNLSNSRYCRVWIYRPNIYYLHSLTHGQVYANNESEE